MLGKKLVFFLLFTTLCSTIAAQEIDSLRHLDIEGVVVFGNKINKETIPVQVLGGEELKRLSAHSVADAVRYFSGVQIKDYGGIGGLKTINVRSMGSNHVGVFFDGVQIGNAQNGVVDLGRFSLDNMETVSMYNGQKSAIFQSAKDYASASAIYMTTRKPKFESGKDYNFNLGLKGGSFKTINPSVLWEQRLSKSIRSSVSAEYMYTSGEYPFTYTKEDGYNVTETRENGDIRYFRAEAALFGDITNGEWQTKVYLYNSERGYPGAVVREEPGVFKNADRQWDNNIFIQGSMRKMISPKYSLKINAKYANDYLHYLSDPNLDTSTMYVDNTYKQQEGYASIVNMLNVCSWVNVAIASDFQYNTLDADLVDFVYPERFTSLTSLAASINHKGFKMQGSLLYTHVTDKTEVESANADNLDEFTPSIVASFQVAKDFNIRAFYKRVFRMPTLNDLYYTFIGNINLNPEYTNQYNIGVTYQYKPQSSYLKLLDLQADIYYNEVEDKIIAMPTSNQFRWTMINLGYVEIRGIDAVADARWQFGKVGVTTRLNYTYQKAQDFTDPTSDYYGGQIPYTPWHSGSFILGADYRGWSFNYSYIYTGERYESVANILENYSQPWYTSDISLGKNLRIRGTEMRITAELNNIFNQQYEVVQCYPMPGINYKLKLNIIL
ncbi:MAG: TonB-dependent receptor [Rikenellaceae bacterium]